MWVYRIVPHNSLQKSIGIYNPENKLKSFITDVSKNNLQNWSLKFSSLGSKDNGKPQAFSPLANSKWWHPPQKKRNLPITIKKQVWLD